MIYDSTYKSTFIHIFQASYTFAIVLSYTPAFFIHINMYIDDQHKFLNVYILYMQDFLNKYLKDVCLTRTIKLLCMQKSCGL